MNPNDVDDGQGGTGDGEDGAGDRPVIIEKYLKHGFSCLPDCALKVRVDSARMVVTITGDAFDSHLFGWLVTKILPAEHSIVAYRDDDAGWHPPRPPYGLNVRIGGDIGVEFCAEVVRLSTAVGGGVAIRLSDPQVRR